MTNDREAFRQRAIRQLQDKQRQRAEKLLEIRRQQSELEAEDLPLKQAALRASKPLPEGCCPRCWIFDRRRVDLTPEPGTDDMDFFRCGVCDHLFETPIG